MKNKRRKINWDKIMELLPLYLAQDGYLETSKAPGYEMNEHNDTDLPSQAISHNKQARLYYLNNYEYCFNPSIDVYLLSAYRLGFYFSTMPNYADAVDRNEFYGKFQNEFDRGIRDGKMQNLVDNKNWLSVFENIKKRLASIGD